MRIKMSKGTSVMKVTFFHLSVLFLFTSLSTSNTFAQMQPPDHISGAPAGSYKLNSFEDVNLFNGHLNISLPVIKISGRGDAGHSMLLRMDTRWTIRRDEECDPETGFCTVEYEPYVTEDSEMSVSAGGLSAELIRFGTDPTGICQGYVYSTIKLVIKTPDGTAHEFIDTATGGNANQYYRCATNAGYRGQTFVSTDGSAATFITDNIIYDSNYDIYMGFNHHVAGYLYLADGTRYRTGALGGSPPPNPIRDRNGNLSGILQDSIGRQVMYDENGVKVKGVGGIVERTYQVVSSQLSTTLRTTQPGDSPTIRTLGELFPDLDQPYPNDVIDLGVISSLIFPNGQNYQFKYDVYGFLARVVLPTGGAYEYDYYPLGGAAVWGAQLRAIKEKRTYDEYGNLVLITKFSYSGSGSTSETYASIAEVTNFRPDGATIIKKTKHYFHGTPYNYPGSSNPYSWWRDGKEFRTEYWNESGTAILKTVDKTWFQYHRSGCTIQLYACPPNNPRVSDETTTLNDTNQVSKVVYEYDDDVPYNNVKNVLVYDWGTGAPGSLLSQTKTTYEKSNLYISYTGSHLRRLPLETTILSGSGQTFSRTKYEYDNYPLLTRNDVFGHDTTNFGTDYTRRGNVTSATSYENAQSQTGAVINYFHYDILGNVVEKIDAKNNATTINYVDKFGLPDGEATSNTPPGQLSGLNTFAFPTSTTNALGWTTHAQFDYYTGVTVNMEDTIGVISKTLYDDLLDRPTQTFTAVGTASESQSKIIYDDAYRRILTTSDLNTLNDNLIKSESFYDGLGRTKEDRSYKDGDYVVAKTDYDALGRVKESTYPYRPLRNEQAVLAKTKYDGLGRVIEIETPDGARVLKSYSGSVTTVTDQAGKKRRGLSDALGRTTQVIEDPDGQNLVTNYTFDAAGNLRKTIQGGQSRYFSYDSLGRLLYAKQPEQNVNPAFTATDSITGNSQWSLRYQYDENSNIVSTTDPRGISIEADYDDLNRLTVRDYSDSTPDVTFTYDNLPNSKGKLTKVTNGFSTTDYMSFDILGRSTRSKQTTDGVVYGTDENPMTYTYNLSGVLVEQTYPSGRKVKNVIDNDGQISIVQSKKNADSGYWNYAKNIIYNASGAVTSLQLGNGYWETAVYNNRSQATQIGLGRTNNTQDLLKLEFSYGNSTQNNSSIKEQKITVPTIGANQGFTALQSYAYDDLNRLQSATENISSQQTWKQTFQYDRYGNRRFDAVNTTTLGNCAAEICNPDIGTADNRLSLSQGYEYDENGNLTQDAADRRFGYDAENHQKEFFVSTNSSSTPDATYFYDGEGRRVKKISTLETTIFVYDASGKLVAEYSNQTETEPKVSYLTTDHLGSPRIITGGNGEVLSRKDFAAFGDEIVSPQRTGGPSGNGYDPPGVRQDYTGYQKDEESGLEYAQARYYNTLHGRFTSVDPLTASANVKNPQTFNRYSYALNSPYKFTDPLGLAVCPNVEENCPNPSDAAEGKAAEKKKQDQQQQQQQQQQGQQDAHEALHSQQTQPPTVLGDAVYEPGDGRLAGGEVRTQDLTVIAAIALDPFVNVTEYYASFTMRIVERGTGANRTGYSYEISYDRPPDRNAVKERQKVADSGVIEIGDYKIKSQSTGFDQPLKPFYSGEINETRTGTITIYASNGDKVGTTKFEATVKTTEGGAAVGDHRTNIVETQRTVGKVTWNRPSP
jgi:RHS repeat-associated protein